MLETISLRARFVGEHLPPEANAVFPGRQVEYLDEEQRARFLLSVDHEGRLRTATGDLFDTSLGISLHTPGGGRAIFVLTGDGRVYASNRHVAGRFQHSSLLAGAPVAGAGELRVINGVLELISNRSHHYMPPPDFATRTIRHIIRSMRVATASDAKVDTVDWTTVR